MMSPHPSWHTYPPSTSGRRKLAYARAPCPNCYGGAALIAYRCKNGQAVLVCEDCEAAYGSLETLAAGREASDFTWNDVHGLATVDDARRLGILPADLFSTSDCPDWHPGD